MRLNKAHPLPQPHLLGPSSMPSTRVDVSSSLLIDRGLLAAWTSRTPLSGKGAKDSCASSETEGQEVRTALDGAPGSMEEISSNHINMVLRKLC